MVKKILLALLLVTIAVHGPWRVAYLFAQTLVSAGGPTRVSDKDDSYWRARDLEDQLDHLGWDLQYVEGMTSVYGTTSPHLRAIRIDGTLHWNARLAILAHEGGHTQQPSRLTNNQSEVFAEAVAYVVARDGVTEHARYLSALRGDLLVLVVYWRDIYRAAAVLESRS